MTATNHRRPHESAREAVVRILPPTMTDAALVKSLQGREPGSAEMLFERYGPYVQRLIVRTVGLDAEVPDLINEVFARALEGIHDVRQLSALKGWIGSVALFTARGFLRRRRVRRRWLSAFSIDEVPEAEAAVASPEVSQILVRTYLVLNTLPADERIAFALQVIDGMDVAEIAQMAGVSLATAKRRLARAKRTFWEKARNDPMLRDHAPKDEKGDEP